MTYGLRIIVKGKYGEFPFDLMIDASFAECIAHIADLIQDATVAKHRNTDCVRYEILEEHAGRVQFVHELENCNYVNDV